MMIITFWLFFIKRIPEENSFLPLVLDKLQNIEQNIFGTTEFMVSMHMAFQTSECVEYKGIRSKQKILCVYLIHFLYPDTENLLSHSRFYDHIVSEFATTQVTERSEFENDAFEVVPIASVSQFQETGTLLPFNAAKSSSQS